MRAAESPKTRFTSAVVRMPGDVDLTALNAALLKRTMPDSSLSGEANLLVMPNLDAANITFSALKIVAGQGISVGPILLGASRPVHILSPTSTVRGIVNMTALTAVAAGS